MATAKAEENKLTDMKPEVVVVPVSDVDRACGSRKRGLPKGPSGTWVGSPIPITGHAGHRQQ